MDFTFQTNQTGLLLGASGAAGVVVERSGPVVRFKEDEVAQHFAAKLLLEQTEKLGVPLSHGFADCSCYNAVASLCAQEGLNLKLHRCLQHVAWCHQDRMICAFFCFTCDHICNFIDEKIYLMAIAAGNASMCLFASQFPKVKRNLQDAARSR